MITEQLHPPVAPKGYSGRALIVSVAAGFVAAAAICVALTAGGLPGQQKTGGEGSKAGISLPAHVHGYSRLADIPITNSKDGRKTVAGMEADDRNTAAALSAAHGGAGAAVGSYGSHNMQTLFSVWAVRDGTPSPVVPVVNAARLGMAVAPDVVRRFGEVFCHIQYDFILKGRPITPDHTHTLSCQRSNSSLTVTVYGPGVLGGHPDQVVALVNAVWSQLN